MGMFWLGLDPTFILIIIGMGISMAASSYVKRTYAKYDQVRSQNGYSGEQAAAYILRDAEIHDVGVQRISGDLTDNYNSHTKMLSLSETVSGSQSVAAIGVAAHECGHAVQDHQSYLPLKIRGAIVPVVNFGSMASMPLIIAGIIFGGNGLLINLGIMCFALVFLFQVVTLPVEINASRRALTILERGEILTAEELPMARQVLIAAALTYVASAVASLLQLLRLVLLFNNRRD